MGSSAFSLQQISDCIGMGVASRR